MPEEHKKTKDEFKTHRSEGKDIVLSTKMEAVCYFKMCPHVYIGMQRKGRVMEH